MLSSVYIKDKNSSMKEVYGHMKNKYVYIHYTITHLKYYEDVVKKLS